MATIPAPPSQGDLYRQTGYSGLPRYGGWLFDEWLPELQGARGRRVIREMRDNDPVIGAILFGIEGLIRQVEWTIEPDEAAGEDDERPQFVDECLNDMDVPWSDRLSEILSFLWHGWAYHEIVYKRRDGTNGTNGRFGDGRIGWADWPIRGQESLLRWEFDDDGHILGMWQLGPPTYKEVFVPIEKSLLFRTSVSRGSPEGRSILRNAYRPWFLKKNIEVFEAIGIERDLAGIPYLRIPGSILQAASDPANNPDEYAALLAYQQLITSVKVNENAGIILPSDVDPDTKTPQYEFQLLRSSGGKQFDTEAIIQRLDLRIAQTCLADFIQLGHGATGSRALAESKTELFTAALRQWLHSICAVVNDVAIPRLLRLNGMSTDMAPRLKHEEIEREDLDALGNYVLRLAQAGFQFDTRFDAPLTTDLLQKGRLPDPPTDEPPVLDEPTAVYEQDTQETPTEADANAPKPGAKRKPTRPPRYAMLT